MLDFSRFEFYFMDTRKTLESTIAYQLVLISFSALSFNAYCSHNHARPLYIVQLLFSALKIYLVPPLVLQYYTNTNSTSHFSNSLLPLLLLIASNHLRQHVSYKLLKWNLAFCIVVKKYYFLSQIFIILIQCMRHCWHVTIQRNSSYSCCFFSFSSATVLRVHFRHYKFSRVCIVLTPIKFQPRKTNQNKWIFSAIAYEMEWRMVPSTNCNIVLRSITETSNTNASSPASRFNRTTYGVVFSADRQMSLCHPLH